MAGAFGASSVDFGVLSGAGAGAGAGSGAGAGAVIAGASAGADAAGALDLLEDELREGADFATFGAGAGGVGAMVAVGGATMGSGVALGALLVASLMVAEPVAELASARTVGEA